MMRPAPQLPASVRAALIKPEDEAREIVAKAWRMRQGLLKRGAGHIAARELHTPMVMLQVWLQRNPHPSMNTMRQFRASMAAALRTVLPHNAAGDSLMHRFHEILNTTP